MIIPLNEFEQLFDSAILQRGYKYFKNGMVDGLEEINNGEYEAIVEGSESYTVRLKLENSTVTEHDCSCPYNLGPVCKHIAAVIYYLKQKDFKIDPPDKITKSNIEGKTKKKSTVSEQVDDLLNTLSHDNIKAFVREKCDTDRAFRQLFIGRFANLIMDDSKEFYARQVREILRRIAGRDGFIEYKDAGTAGAAVTEILCFVDKHLESGNYKSAMHLVCAVLEEMDQARDFADDSSGDIGGCI